MTEDKYLQLQNNKPTPYTEPLIPIYPVIDLLNGDTIGCYAKGHHSPVEFITAAIDSGEIDFDEDEQPQPDQVTHEYWRVVPGRDEYGYSQGRFMQAKQGSRGAFAVTYLGKEFLR